jgi:hypothetical protein
MNRKNLQALAKFLRELANPAHFNMRYYMADNDDGVREFQPREAKQYQNECGTVACAVGHGPFLFPVIEDDLSWGMYSERVFGLSLGDTTWNFMFSGHWAKVDNTPLGAAKRIEYVLSGKPVPDSNEQREMWYGRIPLCYG